MDRKQIKMLIEDLQIKLEDAKRTRTETPYASIYHMSTGNIDILNYTIERLKEIIK